MKSQIDITDDLADVFMIQSLREGYCDYLAAKEQDKRNDFANYMIKKGNFDKITYSEKFDRISQLMIMYDKIEFPIANFGFELHGKIEEIANINRDLPIWFYSDRQVTTDELSDDDAMKMKPIIMSAIKNINFSDTHVSYAVKRRGSIEELYSTIYDMMYNHKSEVFDEILQEDATIGYGMYSANEQPNPDSPSAHILYSHKVIMTLVKSMMVYLILNKSGECDYYSKVFTNFNTEINLNVAYGMIKTQLSYIMERQPAFESLSEIMSFRKKKKKAIHDFREEINSLECLLKEGASEVALQKAINDVRFANEVLIKNSPSKKIAQIATYISVPISVIEFLTFGTPFSMVIGVVGTIAQLRADINDRQSDWLFIAR